MACQLDVGLNFMSGLGRCEVPFVYQNHTGDHANNWTLLCVGHHYRLETYEEGARGYEINHVFTLNE